MKTSLAKADLHVHSRASNKPAGWLSTLFECPESYTEPLELYNTLKKKGMDFITITDHNTIDGVLEIAHLPEVFIGCEYTVRFKEEEIDIHVLCYGITEDEHKTLNKLRENVYDFIDYIKEKNIAHTLAHPLYPVNRKPLTTAIVEKFVLLFDNWEIINGTRTKNTKNIEKAIAEKYSSWETIRKLEEKYNIKSRRTREKISFTAGTDDHGGMDAGRTWTSAKANSKDDFINAIRNGKTFVNTEELGEERLLNTVTRIAYKHIATNYNLCEEVKEIADHIFQYKENKLLNFIIKNHIQKEIDKNILIKEIIKRAPFWSIERLQKNFSPTTVGEMILTLSSQLLPALILFLQKEEEYSIKNIAKSLNISLNGHQRLAYITDTYYEINGVARTAQLIKRISKKYNLPVDIITMSHGKNDDYEIINLHTYLDLPTPFYEEFRLRIPSLLDIFDLIKEKEYSHIHISTPAPLGLLFFLAGKVFKLPISFTFHTDVPAYVYRYTENKSAYEAAWQFFTFFSNLCDKVLVPSKVYAEKLKNMGVLPHKIKTFVRGVDTTLFDPNKKDPDFWTKELGKNLGEKKIVLYVGRVSKEKNLDLFLKVARNFQDNAFVIVGDGPYRPQLEQAKPENVFFTGYMEGDKLARAYSSSDIFLFPSETETYGLVILEAMASGLPVIVSNKGAASEKVRHGFNGYIAKNEKEFINYLNILVNNEGLKNKLATQAYLTAQELNLEDSYVKYIKEIIFHKETVSENSRPDNLLSREEWWDKEVYR
ncbi:glycosyltransferase [Thermodesulfatator atlanticus]